jgi:F-type H+-transporting ATPase subunit b
MDLLSPEPGLVIWSGLTFLAVLALLTKFAWKPLLGMIKEREDEIEGSLEKAKQAQQEYARLEAEKKLMAEESRKERDQLLKETKEKVQMMLDDARAQAQTEGNKLLAEARSQIEKEKAAALTELREQVASLSVEIAGKLIGDSLSAADKQKELIDKYLQESNFN